MSLKWPLVLALILIPILLIIIKKLNKKSVQKQFIAKTKSLKSLPSYNKVKKYAKRRQFINAFIVWTLLILFLLLMARPIAPSAYLKQEKSRDIIFTLDVSGSMKKYINPSLEAMQKIVDQNPNEKYGIVIFAKRSATALPLTNDPTAIKQSIDDLKNSYSEDTNISNYKWAELVGGGTDIGEAVLGSVNRFGDLSTQRSRTIIMLSDLVHMGAYGDTNDQYLSKVNLIPKNNINFYIIKAPTGQGYYSNDEIASMGGGQIFDLPKDSDSPTINQITQNVFNQALNTNINVTKSLIDSPNIIFAISGILILIWVSLLTKKKRPKQ